MTYTRCRTPFFFVLTFVLVFLVSVGVLVAQGTDAFLESEDIFDGVSIDLKVNGEDGPITVNSGDRIVVSWLSEGAARCKGNWSKNDIKTSGTVSGRISRSVVIKAACIDKEGNRDDDAVVVNVSGKPSVVQPIVPPASAITPIVRKSTPSKQAGAFTDGVATAILVIPVDFLTSGERPYTREELHALVFEGQVQKFFEEQSYGRFRLSGKTLPWTTLQRDGPLNATCGSVTDADIASAVSSNAIDLASYSIVLVLANLSVGDCAAIGSSQHSINGRVFNFADAIVSISPDVHPAGHFPQPFSWTGNDYGISHELGHALGVNHSNGLDCGMQQVSGECVLREYQNYFDVMGAGKYSLHFSSVLKESLGWLTQNDVVSITQSGRYTLNSFETPGGAHVAKIAVPGSATGEYIYAEYRNGAGFDVNLKAASNTSSGLFITVVRKDPSGAFAPYLVDANPSEMSWDEDVKDAALSINGSKRVFLDESRGITIGPIADQESNSITFDVVLKMPSCVRNVPAITKHFISPNFVFPDKASLYEGESGVMSMGFSNTDYSICGPSRFRIIPIIPNLWSYTMLDDNSPFSVWDVAKEVTVNPGDGDGRFINFSVPTDTVSGVYPIGYKVVNLESGLEAVKEFKVTVMQSQPPKSILVDLKVNIGNGPTDGPVTVTAGTIIGLTYTTTGKVEQCTGDVSGDASGGIRVIAQTSKTYTVTCVEDGGAGRASDSVTVTVTPSAGVQAPMQLASLFYSRLHFLFSQLFGVRE